MRPPRKLSDTCCGKQPSKIRRVRVFCALSCTTTDQRWKMALVPALIRCAHLCRRANSQRVLPMAPEDGPLGQCHHRDEPSSSKQTRGRALPNSTRRWPPGPVLLPRQALKRELKRVLHLPRGSPCLCWNSTRTSSECSTQPASWRIQHCSRKAPTMSRTHLPGRDNLCLNPTAPLFLRYRPACLPIREPVLA